MEARMESSTIPGNRRFSTEKIVEDIKNVIHRAEEKAVQRAKAADRVVRDHPYQTVGLAFSLGLLIGLLARRK